jgi:hypothetical protein
MDVVMVSSLIFSNLQLYFLGPDYKPGKQCCSQTDAGRSIDSCGIMVGNTSIVELYHINVLMSHLYPQKLEGTWTRLWITRIDPIISPKARIKHGLAVVSLDYLYISLIIDVAS